jgi:amino acid adenylation domain-containing protein
VKAEPTFVELFRQRVRATPGAPAIVSDGSVLSYRDVDLASDRLAAVLLEHGLMPGEAVGVSVPRLEVAVCAVLAAMKAGLVVLLLDPEHPVASRIEQVAYARCVLVISDDERKLTHATPNVSPTAQPFAAAVTGTGPAPEDAAYIVYTSGSTGQPKGVVCTHGSLSNVAEAQRRLLHVRAEDRVAINAPVTVDAFYFEITLALGAGACLHVPHGGERQAGPRFRRFLRERDITVLVSTPTKLRTLDPADHKSIRLVVSAGEALDTGLARQWAPGRRLVNAYGPTEATIWTTVADISGTEHEIPLGAAIPGCRVDVLRGDLTDAAADEVGELYISGAGLAIGYLHDPGDDRFIKLRGERAYRTGDRAVRRRDGSLIYVGRDDDQVKVSGFRVELGEVRHHLRQHPQVGDAAVRVDDGRLVAYTTPAGPRAAQAGPEALRQFLESRLPRHKVPASYISLPSLPETTWGKVDLASLPAPAEVSSHSDGGYQAGTPVEQYVMDKVSEMLGRQVDSGDDLFLLGLDSILVARLMNDVNRDLSVELEHIEVFEHPTIDGLAEYIAERSGPSAQVLG